MVKSDLRRVYGVAMNAGIELDALIAKHVMGLRVLKTGDYLWWVQGGDGGEGEALPKPFPIPAYSSDIAAAWSVVERVQRLPRECDFRLLRLNWGGWLSWCAGFGFIATGQGEATVLSEGRADTAPHAICLAALRAVGVEVTNEIQV